MANGIGSATITVTVNDGGASNNIVTQTFTVTVNPVNQAPTLNALANVTITENAGLQTVSLSGITSGATNQTLPLTVTASSSNTGLIPTPTVNYTSPNTTGSITFTPVASAYGSATVTVTVNNGGASNNVVSRSFTVTVDSPPTITSITNLVIAMDTADSRHSLHHRRRPNVRRRISPCPAVRTMRPSCCLPTSCLAAATANRTVTITPEAGQTGVANITITVSDGTDTTSSVFQLSVRQRPAAPGSLRIASTGP